MGDVIYIEANSGAVKRVGRCDTYATEFDLEAEEYVPLPKVCSLSLEGLRGSTSCVRPEHFWHGASHTPDIERDSTVTCRLWFVVPKVNCPACLDPCLHMRAWSCAWKDVSQGQHPHLVCNIAAPPSSCSGDPRACLCRVTCTRRRRLSRM